MMHVADGHTKNPLLTAPYPAATGCRLIEAASGEAVLLGTAMIAATGAGLQPSLAAAGGAMVRDGRIREPDKGALPHLDRDRQMFRRLIHTREGFTASAADPAVPARP